MLRIAQIIQYFQESDTNSIMFAGQLAQCRKSSNAKNLIITYQKDGTMRVTIKYSYNEYGSSDLSYSGTTQDIQSLHSLLYGKEN